MHDYSASTYGDRIAGRYDEWYEDLPFGGDLQAAVAFLHDAAAGGAALELGIGTGRVAIPLHAAGVEVHGIDASDAMLERLRAKPGGDAISTTTGDFGDFDLGGGFALVYVVFNTFFALTSQDAQVAAFRTIADHLEPGGVFVMEAFVPDVGRFDRGHRVAATSITIDEVRLEVATHDPVEQVTTSQQIAIGPDGIRLYPVVIRYAYPAELDLMARLAGLRLRQRWAEWDRTPFTTSATKHISVWGRPEA